MGDTDIICPYCGTVQTLNDELVKQLELLVQFTEDSPKLDYKEDKTLSWIGVMTDATWKLIGKAKEKGR